MTNKKPLSDYAKYSSLGLQMAVFIAACALGGKYLDKQGWMDFPLFTVAGVLIGVFGAMYFMFKQIK